MILQDPRSGIGVDPLLDPPPMWRMAKPFTGLANFKSCIQAASSDFDDPQGDVSIFTEERLHR